MSRSARIASIRVILVDVRRSEIQKDGAELAKLNIPRTLVAQGTVPTRLVCCALGLINNSLQRHHMPLMRNIRRCITAIKMEFKNAPLAGELPTPHRCTERLLARLL